MSPARMALSSRAVAGLVVYAGAYAASLRRLAASPGFEAGEALAVMLIFGLGFSLAAWAATLGTTPELAPQVPAEPWQSVAVLVAKLGTMVAIPGWLLTRLGHSWGALLAPRRIGRAGWRALLIMAALVLALQLTVGRGPGRIAALDVSLPVIVALTPLAFVWMCLEAGLTEEFLFRRLFQAYAAAWLRSETAAIVAMALVFGLAHAPGYVLRGAHAMEGISVAPDALTAAAYSIVVVSPIGLMFGVLWVRTRNLLFIVLLHGWADLVPNLAPFVRTWTSD